MPRRFARENEDVHRGFRHWAALLRASLLHLRGSGNGHADAVDRLGGGDEQAPEVVVAPTEVGGVFGHLDYAEAGRIGREHVDAARTAAVDVAPAVDLHAVGCARTFADR